MNNNIFIVTVNGIESEMKKIATTKLEKVNSILNQVNMIRFYFEIFDFFHR